MKTSTVTMTTAKTFAPALYQMLDNKLFAVAVPAVEDTTVFFFSELRPAFRFFDANVREDATFNHLFAK
jgi:hypothetical protein